MTSEYIKAKAKEFGATVCGIGNVELLRGEDIQRNPFSILPGAKTIIGFYGGKYIMMTKEVLPFVTEVVIPEVRKMAQKNRKEIAAGYGRPKTLFFGRK